MASLNKKEKLRTHEGAVASNVTIKQQLERSVMSCLLWEDEFYENGVHIAHRIRELCSKLKAHEVIEMAIKAKTEMRLRHVPLLLVREAITKKEGRALLNDVLPHIITRPDDITEFLAIYWKDNKDEPLAKQLKIHLGNCFRRFDEYQLAKYNRKGKLVSLRDAIRILRPKPENDTESVVWNRLVNNDLNTPDTWEVALSAAKSEDHKKAEWIRLILDSKLGGLALLRNIRNMNQVGVSHELIKVAINSINAGKLLPINFISAAKHNPTFESDIEKKFFECFQKDKLKGRTVILVDVSWSMNEKLSNKSELKRLDVACSLAMIARETFEDVSIFSFSDKVISVPARRGFALRDAIVNSQPMNGTKLGNAVRAMPNDCRLIVITDEQSSDPVPQRKGYMINVASNKNGVGYGQWTHIDGWSDKVIDYIVKYEQTNE